MPIDFSKYISSASPHYISNSGKDEHSQYRGGQAGDQSGHEWELKGWYNRPWSVVLRYPSVAVGIKIAELGIAAALNDKIGYDQGQRTTYWNELQKANYDPSAITTHCEEDCTAGVTANVKAVGYLLGIEPLKNISTGVYSGNMRNIFVSAGFNALTSSKFTDSPDYLLPGDILLYEDHHAATNISYGSRVQRDEYKETSSDSYIDATNGNYYVRTAPNGKAKKIGLAEKGDRLIFLGEVENNWYKVRFSGEEGWISAKCGNLVEVENEEEDSPFIPECDEEYPSDDLEPEETSGKVEQVMEVKELKIKSVFTRMRSAAGSKFQKIMTLRRGEIVKYLGEEKDGWLYIRFRGVDGWIKAKVLEEVK